MRVQILRAMSGVIEGQALSQLIPGFVYELETAVGAQLVALGAAVEVRDPVTPGSDGPDLERLSGGVSVTHRDVTADHPRRRRKRR